MIFKRIKEKFNSFRLQERCPRRFLLSFCMGVYIAFSPFVGFHTAMVFLFSWIFALNAAVVLGVSVLINNPWTMVPVYGSGHLVGDCVFSVIGIDSMSFNPSWMGAINVWIFNKIGIAGLSLPAFFIGGNLLGLAISGMLYHILKRFLVPANSNS